MKPFNWVLDYIDQLAQEYPERVAKDEDFNEDGSPCCIFGHVIHALGGRLVSSDVDGDITVNAEGLFAYGAGTPVQNIPWNAFGVEEPDSRQAARVRHVQLSQDSGECWADAVA